MTRYDPNKISIVLISAGQWSSSHFTELWPSGREARTIMVADFSVSQCEVLLHISVENMNAEARAFSQQCIT